MGVMKARILAAALFFAAASPTLAQSSGWALEAGTGTAVLSHGKAGTSGAFRLECNDGQSVFTTWARRAPRNAGDGEMASAVRIFQGRTEIVYSGTGRPEAGGTFRIDAPIRDAGALLEGARRNGRLVVVTHAGRSTAPAPDQTTSEKFVAACAKAPKP